jgi:acyl carrier protein
VPQEHRRAFLGQAAAAMLAALGAFRPAVAEEPPHSSLGIPPDRPPIPPEKAKTVEERVIDIVSKRTGVEAKNIKRSDTLVRDLKAKPDDLEQMRKDLEKEFNIEISAPDFKKVRFVANAVTCVQKAIDSKPRPPASPPGSAGIRPGTPPSSTPPEPPQPPFSCGGMWAPRSSN